MSKLEKLSRLELLKKLKDELVLFFDELIELIPEEPDLVVIRIFMKDKFPIQDVMEYIVKKLVPLKQMVIQKDDGFFLNNNILFDEIDEKKVNHFKNLWQANILDEEDRSMLWQWFRGFIVMAEIYDKKDKNGEE